MGLFPGLAGCPASFLPGGWLLLPPLGVVRRLCLGGGASPRLFAGDYSPRSSVWSVLRGPVVSFRFCFDF